MAGSQSSEPDKARRNAAMVAALRSAGVSASVVEAPGKSHGGINQDIGRVNDAVTRATVRFLAEKLGN